MPRAYALSLLLVLPLVACEEKPKESPKPEPTTSAPPTATRTTSATTAIASAAPTETTTAAPTATASSSAGPVASASGKKPDPKDAKSGATAALKPASKHVGGNNFGLDLFSPGCKAAEECSMTIKLAPAGDYHINKQYPYKFIASAAPNVTFLGKGDPNTFQRSSGDFVEAGEKSGTMTVRFKPASAGEAKVMGKYKFSVCSADQCQIEESNLDLSIPVM